MLISYPKDCSTTLIKQVLPKFRHPTKFFNASPELFRVRLFGEFLEIPE